MVGHEGSSTGSYLANNTSPIPSHCASIVATSTLTVNLNPVPNCNELLQDGDEQPTTMPHAMSPVWYCQLSTADVFLIQDTRIVWTRSTQRAETSLAEADHYSHIAHCKNVEPCLWKTTHPPLKTKRFWIITCTTIWVCYHYYGVFLLIYSSYNTQITTKI